MLTHPIEMGVLEIAQDQYPILTSGEARKESRDYFSRNSGTVLTYILWDRTKPSGVPI